MKKLKRSSHVSYGFGTQTKEAILCKIDLPQAYFNFSFDVAYYMIGNLS